MVDKLEELTRWLKSFPGWDRKMYLDYTESSPGNTGLFPTGAEELERHEDVLGNVQVRCRYRFQLYRVTARQESNARWMLDFQNWVQQQSEAGLSPRFGDNPAEERIRAEKGALSKVRQPAACVYSVTLTAEFTKYYEVI